MFQGESIVVLLLADGLVELRFDRRGEAINKLDARTVEEFRQATASIAAEESVRGVLVTSAKTVFIVGADINEFSATFRKAEEAIAIDVRAGNETFNRFEDLPVPSVVAINGFALGGGLELALLAPLRVMSETAKIGVPEVKLGLLPGFGGTVRLARTAGLATAMEWVASGASHGADEALQAGIVNEVVPPELLRDRALDLLRRAARGDIDWRGAQRCKRVPVSPSLQCALQAGNAAYKAATVREARHQPAAAIALDMMVKAAQLDRGRALDLESAAFGRVAKTQAASSLVQAFLNEQALKKLNKRRSGDGRAIQRAAVLGAGSMGGGIAYAAALWGTPVRMKDISKPALELGLAEAARQLGRQVRAGRLSEVQSDGVLAAITPQLDERGFDNVDCVIEAVVEDLCVKRKVLLKLEKTVQPGTLIASNTSSLRIDDIADALARPADFVGMHFFNPVPVMSLVEVIKGSRSSDSAVSTAVRFAVAMGKIPVVVKDQPGFLVNRIYTPYVNAFTQLLADGGDFEEIDRVMEAFGWPMGPAYLQDVVGMDVGARVGELISAGYSERMRICERNAVELMVANHRFGQKTGLGFYRYEMDKAGRPRKSVSPEARQLVASIQTTGKQSFADLEILERMMLPMIVEAAHALEEGVVETPAELDTALLLGLGFPAYAGGPLQYADWLGPARVVALCEGYAALGPQYQATPGMCRMARDNLRYHAP